MRHHRLRHGHRQEQRALGDTLQHAQEHRELLPGDYIEQDADLHKEYVNKKLYKVLNKLTLREKAVICLIYGIQCQQMYLPDIAKLFGVCEERIRQIKEKALSRLKKYKRYFIEINYE